MARVDSLGLTQSNEKHANVCSGKPRTCAATEIQRPGLVLKIIVVLVFILFSSQNFYFI